MHRDEDELCHTLLQPQSFECAANGILSIVGQNFCSPYTSELTVVKKAMSLSGGDCTVTDNNGNLVLTVDGPLFTFHNNKVLRDGTGNPLITMRAKPFSIYNKWEAFKGENTEAENLLFSAQRSSIFQLRPSIDVIVDSSTCLKTCDFHVNGSFLTRSCTIYDGNRMVAEINRRYTAIGVLLGTNTFVIRVQPGIDYVFIVALVVILDEINKANLQDL